MTTPIITALEQAVLKSIKNLNPACIFVPQNLIANENVKANQVAAIVNNLIGKGFATSTKDLFGTNVSLTRTGKIRATKLQFKNLQAA